MPRSTPSRFEPSVAAQARLRSRSGAFAHRPGVTPPPEPRSISAADVPMNSQMDSGRIGVARRNHGRNPWVSRGRCRPRQGLRGMQAKRSPGLPFGGGTQGGLCTPAQGGGGCVFCLREQISREKPSQSILTEPVATPKAQKTVDCAWPRRDKGGAPRSGLPLRRVL